MKKIFKLLICLAFMSVFLNSTQAVEIESKSTLLQPSKSKAEFEIALASKFQLLKVRMEQFKKMNECFSLLSQKLTESKETLEERQVIELAESVGLADVSKIDQSLKGLINNYYVGDRAKYLISLVREKQNKKIEDEFTQLESEVKSDIEIAKSLGIDVDQYNQSFSNYAWDRMMSVMWASIFSGNNKNNSKN